MSEYNRFFSNSPSWAGLVLTKDRRFLKPQAKSCEKTSVSGCYLMCLKRQSSGFSNAYGSNMNKQNSIEIYQTNDGETRIEVRLEQDTLWLSLQQIADLFGRDKSVISRHFKNIFDTEELLRKAVVAKNATTATDGKTYQVEYFNLDAIISVDYCRTPNSHRTIPRIST